MCQDLAELDSFQAMPLILSSSQPNQIISSKVKVAQKQQQEDFEENKQNSIKETLADVFSRIATDERRQSGSIGLIINFSQNTESRNYN